MQTIIVTQHPSYAKLCVEAGLCSAEDKVVTHATLEDVAGNRVITSGLPIDLALACGHMVIIPLEIWKAPKELRDLARERDLTAEELRPFARMEDIKEVCMVEKSALTDSSLSSIEILARKFGYDFRFGGYGYNSIMLWLEKAGKQIWSDRFGD